MIGAVVWDDWCSGLMEVVCDDWSSSWLRSQLHVRCEIMDRLVGARSLSVFSHVLLLLLCMWCCSSVKGKGKGAKKGKKKAASDSEDSEEEEAVAVAVVADKGKGKATAADKGGRWFRAGFRITLQTGFLCSCPAFVAVVRV